jgi:hypothetical protein
MWLRHFLPVDVPGCRTMIYGYDSNLSPDTQGIHTISDYRDSFLEEVTNARRTEEVGMLRYQLNIVGKWDADRSIRKRRENWCLSGMVLEESSLLRFVVVVGGLPVELAGPSEEVYMLTINRGGGWDGRRL